MIPTCPVCDFALTRTFTSTYDEKVGPDGLVWLPKQEVESWACPHGHTPPANDPSAKSTSEHGRDAIDSLLDLLMRRRVV